jgi:hypothetical protein
MIKWCENQWLVAAALLIALSARATIAGDNGRQEGGQTEQEAQAEKVSRPAKPSSLDDELLKDLGPDSLTGEQGRDARSAAKRSRPSGATDGEADTLDQELLKGLGEGEVAGEPGEKNPLARLSQEMREVEALVAQHRTDDETRGRQSQIVRDIEDLIRRAQKQRQGNNSSSSGGASGKGAQQTTSRRDMTQPGKQSTHAQQSADASARESAKGARQDRARKPEMADMRDILKGVWGQLPERQREQMLQSYEEQFLPKYEQMIADYFRSLAEEQSRKP